MNLFGSKRYVKQYLHAENQFLNSNGRMGYKILQGNKAENQVNFMAIRMITDKKTEDGNPTCSTGDFDHCLYDVMEHVMESEVGCVAPWVVHADHMCLDKESAYRALMIAWDRNTNQRKDCVEPCDFFIMNLGAKNGEQMAEIPGYNETTGSGEGLQVFYFPGRVLVNEEKDLYPLLSLAAEVGGYVGLLLGVSFLQGAQVFAAWTRRRLEAIYAVDVK